MKNKVLYILIKNYIIFALAIGFTVIILFIFLMYQTEKQLGKLNNLKASEVVRENFKTINAESIESFGGWVEILNENLQVIYTKGEKKDKLLSYSQREFTNLLFDNDKLPYYSSVATFVTKKVKHYIALLRFLKKQ